MIISSTLEVYDNKKERMITPSFQEWMDNQAKLQKQFLEIERLVVEDKILTSEYDLFLKEVKENERKKSPIKVSEGYKHKSPIIKESRKIENNLPAIETGDGNILEEKSTFNDENRDSVKKSDTGDGDIPEKKSTLNDEKKNSEKKCLPENTKAGDKQVSQQLDVKKIIPKNKPGKLLRLRLRKRNIRKKIKEAAKNKSSLNLTIQEKDLLQELMKLMDRNGKVQFTRKMNLQEKKLIQDKIDIRNKMDKIRMEEEEIFVKKLKEDKDRRVIKKITSLIKKSSEVNTQEKDRLVSNIKDLVNANHDKDREIVVNKTKVNLKTQEDDLPCKPVIKNKRIYPKQAQENLMTKDDTLSNKPLYKEKMVVNEKSQGNFNSQENNLLFKLIDQEIKVVDNKISANLKSQEEILQNKILEKEKSLANSKLMKEENNLLSQLIDKEIKAVDTKMSVNLKSQEENLQKQLEEKERLLTNKKKSEKITSQDDILPKQLIEKEKNISNNKISDKLTNQDDILLKQLKEKEKKLIKKKEPKTLTSKEVSLFKDLKAKDRQVTNKKMASKLTAEEDRLIKQLKAKENRIATKKISTNTEKLSREANYPERNNLTTDDRWSHKNRSAAFTDQGYRSSLVQIPITIILHLL